MPKRPDLRDLSRNVHEAFADADRETLLEVLAFVVKEYVVEGPPPALIAPVERLDDLRGLSFAQLVTSLQTRFDHPELALFNVEGEQVMVRVAGTLQPLVASRQPAPEVPRAAPPAAVPSAPVIRAVETSLAQTTPPSASAPRPTGGLAIRGGGPVTRPEPAAPSAPAPAANVATPRPAAVAPAAAAAAATPVAPVAPADKGPERPADDASARFSLLELD